MEAFRIVNLKFAYPEVLSTKSGVNVSAGTRLAVDVDTFTVEDGSFVTLCGPSGCGKTTFLRLLKPSLSPNGKCDGKILFFGSEIKGLEDDVKIGFVHQNPESAIVTDKVKTELAFGLESLGTPPDEIRRRIAEMCSFFGIENLYDRYTSSLSGGQKQLVALGAVLCMQPKVLILDEPLSRLDPISAHDFCNALARINRELGITVIVSEHRPDELLPLSDKAVIMEDGRIIYDGDPSLCPGFLKKTGSEMYGAMPVPSRLVLENSDYPQAGVEAVSVPLSIKGGRRFLSELPEKERNRISEKYLAKSSCDTLKEKNNAVSLKEVFFRYERDGDDILSNVSLEIPHGLHTCILGSNGAGKSTLLSLIDGNFKPLYGKINIHDKGAKIARLPQEPVLLFCCDTVKEDFDIAVKLTGLSSQAAQEKINEYAELLHFDKSLFEMHPADISGGEIQQAAMCKLMLTDPDIYLLDEPTKGMDCFSKEKFSHIVEMLKRKGKTIITVSHDTEFCRSFADVCVMLFRGHVACVQPPKEFFEGNFFYTTAIDRILR